MTRISKIDQIIEMIRNGNNDSEILARFPLMDVRELHRLMEAEYEEMKKIQKEFFRKKGLS